MKILIAEDDLISRRILEAILTKWNYDVISTSDGNEAWEQLNEPNAPKLAILDWMMPGMDGIDLCHRIRMEQRADENYLYLILLTAKSSKEDIVVGIEAGADDYIVKPFDEQELRVRIRAGQRIIKLQTELVEAKESLRIQAMHDPLTGLFNRRAILNQLDRELSFAKRHKKTLAVGLADIDHFKKVNDTYGHQTGDSVLQEFARRVESVTRIYDSVGRYGGEEFLVISPSANVTESRSMFERIRKAIGQEEMRISGKNIQVTVSIGVSIFDGKGSVDDLIQTADSALYRAKASGRNNVEYPSEGRTEDQGKPIQNIL